MQPSGHLSRQLNTCSDAKRIFRIGWVMAARFDYVQAAEIESGKDNVQLKNGPFDLDLIFAPDGIEDFEEAWNRHVEVEGFPVCHLDDIIASKTAADRISDRETLPRLRAFRDYWMKQHE